VRADRATQRRWRFLLAPALTATLAGGCHQYALVGLDDDAGVSSYDATPYDGPSYVDGAVHAHAVFDELATVFWFGGDNDPSRMAVWFYQDRFTCQELSTPWVETVRPTDVMGFTLGGTKPGVYRVETKRPPSPNRAYVLHEIDQADPVIDTVGDGGTVTVIDVKPGVSVTGYFTVHFDKETLEGQFKALWCPTGISLQK
jgi:hypothetical protein